MTLAPKRSRQTTACNNVAFGSRVCRKQTRPNPTGICSTPLVVVRLLRTATKSG